MTSTPAQARRQPDVSLVIPAFNEEARIQGTVEAVVRYLTSRTFDSELIIVDDGSHEVGQRAIGAALESIPGNISHSLIRHETNRGKGAAIRSGCLAAAGQVIAYIDADLACPIEDLDLLLEAIASVDLVIGVRNQSDGDDMRAHRSLSRRLAGKTFSLVMSRLVLPGVSDSQCPLKAFRNHVVQRVFPLQQIESWSFDAEVLYLCKRFGYQIEQVPVRWTAVPGSHLKLNLRSIKELWNLVRIRSSHRRLRVEPHPSLPVTTTTTP